MTEILGDISGVVCLVDDILVTGRTQQQHDARLAEVLARIRKAKVTLGLNKCKFSQPSVMFLGQMVDQSGIRPDPDKVKAITDMSQPSTMSE